MVNRKTKEVNWEKIGVYIAIAGGFFMMISYLFGIKDEVSLLRERLAKLEVILDKKER